MVKRLDPALPLMLGSVLVISLAASAQVNTPAAESNTPAASNPSTLILVDRPRGPPAGSPNDFLPQHLREMLADPERRRQEISLRMRQLRYQHPDFVRILLIDAGAEDKVMAVLANAGLAEVLRLYIPQDTERRQQAARSYDQQISDIAHIIGPDKLDAYLDYERTRNMRSHLQYFDARLPATSKLTDAQKDAMVPLLVEANRQQLRAAWLAPDMDRIIGSELHEKLVADVQQGGSQLANIFSIYANENNARLSEVADRALLEQLSPVLDAEQLRRYAEQQGQPVATLQTQAQQLRRDASAGLDLPPLPAPAPSAPVPGLRLQIRLRINGNELTRTVTSTRGGAVSFDGPGGLLIEAQPIGPAGKQLVVELGFYEPASRGRRLIGDSLGKVDITNPQQPASPFPSHVSILQGRKSYDVEAHVTASLL